MGNLINTIQKASIPEPNKRIIQCKYHCSFLDSLNWKN